MFTGIIECMGCVVENQVLVAGRRLVLDVDLHDVKVGESIAINGVCLTVLSRKDHRLTFDVSEETLALTTLGDLVSGGCVNIERALTMSCRMGGHYVSGHVDTTARVLALTKAAGFVELTIGSFAKSAQPYLIQKGSITLNGVSLTINEVHADHICLMLVPHTLQVTTLGILNVSDCVNVEFDYLARIVAHQFALMCSDVEMKAIEGVQT